VSEDRLQKILAQAGLGSRRACEELIVAGRVTVDGRVVSELGSRFDPAAADIRVDGQPIDRQPKRYVMLHKPIGYLSSVDPRAGYPSWEELVSVPERLFVVGRLDQDSEGLLLLSNDGELAQRLLHPKYEHPKTYLVQVQGWPSPRKLRRLQHGVMLEDGPTAPAKVEMLSAPPELGQPQPRDRSAAKGKDEPPPARSRPSRWLKVTLYEGRKRQLRRMVALLGHPALRVVRIGLGPLVLGSLRPGKWRDLTPGEVRALRESAYRGQPPTQEASSTPKKGKLLAPNTIAIDGPAASGKSTIGRRLADNLDYLYLDTGVMYRAVAAIALARGVSIPDEAAVTALADGMDLKVMQPTVADGRDVTVLVDGVDVSWDIRKPEVERAVSPVSAYRGVRQAMVRQQRQIAAGGRVVMVGRDIGTVVLPDADLKIYLDAALAVRAERRYRERLGRGEQSDFERVLAEMRRRDEIDSQRQHSPLAAAPDAIVIDSTHMDIETVMVHVSRLLNHWCETRRKS
jgi:cytidylate kinase